MEQKYQDSDDYFHLLNLKEKGGLNTFKPYEMVRLVPQREGLALLRMQKNPPTSNSGG
jgi:hypothetical protein